jgi:hypothetical protein
MVLLICYRQRHEHTVFGILPQMVPGLEDCLMEGTDEDIVSIADKVCQTQCILGAITYSMNSFRREYPAEDPMTPRV